MRYLKTIKQLAIKHHITIGTIESLTGGLLASRLTSIDGASQFYQGSIITYANETKSKLLNIDSSLIDKYGSISEPVAQAMASQGQQILNVSICLSLTGNAGPNPIENKPVGLYYLGIAYGKKTDVILLNAKGNRRQIRNKCVKMALKYLYIHLKNI